MTDTFGSITRPLRSSKTVVFDALRAARYSMGERSYSVEGEDRILARVFEGVPKGFYVDVGAHHPMRYSNTFRFYRRGWSGVNIDATPGSMRLFDKYRSRDTNIEAGIRLATGTIPFYVFNEPAINSFDRELSERRNVAPYRIEEIIDVRVLPLKEVLQGRLPRETLPSFLTVDVEGHDLDVLRSNDWSTFRPTCVLAECEGATTEEAMQAPVSMFMSSIGYKCFAKTINTVFYRVEDQSGPSDR
jgi:FkbM family methyltransferase